MKTIQLSLFNGFWKQKRPYTKVEWLVMFLTEAKKSKGLPRFFSEIRLNVPPALVPEKWYREAGRMLRRNGFVKTGRWRQSPILSRMKGDDFEYVEVKEVSEVNRQVTPRPENSDSLSHCPYSKENKVCPYLDGGIQC